jgi:hypothetical protein
MNFGATYETVWLGLVTVSVETQLLPTGNTSHLGRKLIRLVTLNEDITLTQQRGGSDAGLLAGVSLSLPYSAPHTKRWFTACVCPLKSKVCIFKKIVFPYRTHTS